MPLEPSERCGRALLTEETIEVERGLSLETGERCVGGHFWRRKLLRFNGHEAMRLLYIKCAMARHSHGTP